MSKNYTGRGHFKGAVMTTDFMNKNKNRKTRLIMEDIISM
jgi:hypothetical protein